MRDHQAATTEPSPPSWANELSELSRQRRGGPHDHGPRGRETRLPVMVPVHAGIVDGDTGATEMPNVPAPAAPRKRRGRWLVLAAVLVVGSGVVVHHRTRAMQAPVPSETTEPAVLELAPRETVTVRRADLQQTIRLSGTTQAADQVVVRSQLAAKVADISVREGDAVTKGETIATLDIADVKAQLDQRLAALASSEAQLMRAERDRAAKLELAQKGWVAQAVVDQVESAWRDAKGAVAANQALVDMARKALADADIKAPIGGVIGKRNVDPGGVVAVGGEVVTLLDLSRLEVAAAVPANEIARVRTGQSVVVRTGLDAMALRGAVTRINPATEPGSQSIVVHVGLPNADNSLRSGIFVSGSAIVAEAKDALALPIEAIRRDQEGPHVLLVQDGKLVRRAVTTGLSSEAQNLIEIRDGLQDGDRVVVGPAALKAGQAVRVADAEPRR
jgi:membrane fusion protein, multidrug efflux system